MRRKEPVTDKNWRPGALEVPEEPARDSQRRDGIVRRVRPWREEREVKVFRPVVFLDAADGIADNEAHQPRHGHIVLTHSQWVIGYSDAGDGRASRRRCCCSPPP